MEGDKEETVKGVNKGGMDLTRTVRFDLELDFSLDWLEAGEGVEVGDDDEMDSILLDGFYGREEGREEGSVLGLVLFSSSFLLPGILSFLSFPFLSLSMN